MPCQAGSTELAHPPLRAAIVDRGDARGLRRQLGAQVRRADDLERIGETKEPAAEGASVGDTSRDLDAVARRVTAAGEAVRPNTDLHLARLAFRAAQTFAHGANGVAPDQEDKLDLRDDGAGARAQERGNGAEQLGVIAPAPAIGLAPLVGDDREDPCELEEVALEGPAVDADTALAEASFERGGVNATRPLGKEREEMPLTHDRGCHSDVVRRPVWPTCPGEWA